jgi:hypothetical protein
MDFITRDELDKILRGYEKLGASEKCVGKMDVELRVYQQSLVDGLELKMTQLIDNRIAVLSDSLNTQVKSSHSSIQNALTKEVGEILEKSKAHIMESVLASVHKTLRDISSQNENLLKAKINEAKTKFSEEFEIAKNSTLTEVKTSMSGFKHDLENELEEKIFTAISSATHNFTKHFTNLLNESQGFVSDKVLDLMTFVSSELDKKVVDKNAIDSKFVQIEHDMRIKVSEIISFQIEQARHMMEQSARAEIRENLKALAGDILGRV